MKYLGKIQDDKDLVTKEYVDAALSNSDWNEDDTTDLAHVLNRPAIRASDGENSIIEGQIEQDEDAAIYTIYVNTSNDPFTYTTDDTLPSANNIKNYGVYRDVADNVYAIITDIDTTNHTIQLAGFSYGSSATIKQGEIYYKYKYATNNYSHSEGQLTFAGRTASHAEGIGSRAVGYYSHAEGHQSSAAGQDTHAEGYRTKAIGTYSHSEGSNTIAKGLSSHAEGNYTIATGNQSHVQGKYNIEDTSNLYADIVGNGTADNARSNAYTLDWSGNGVYAGKVTVGAGPTNNMDVATKQYADELITALDSTVSATAASGNAYSVLTGVTQADGVLTSKSEVTLAAVAKTGDASDVSITDTSGYFTSGNVEGALAEIGASIAGGGGSSPSPYTSNPAALGTASAGSNDNYSRGDHVHPMPTAANVGAIAAPSSASSGDFLCYNGSAWVATTLSAWQGGSY